jgi:hypothetical protein
MGPVSVGQPDKDRVILLHWQVPSKTATNDPVFIRLSYTDRSHQRQLQMTLSLSGCPTLTGPIKDSNKWPCLYQAVLQWQVPSKTATNDPVFIRLSYTDRSHQRQLQMTVFIRLSYTHRFPQRQLQMTLSLSGCPTLTGSIKASYKWPCQRQGHL